MFRTVLHVTIPTRVQGPQRPLRPEADAARKRTSSPRVSSRTCAGESCRARVTTGRSPPGRAVLIRPRIHPCFVRRAEEGHDPPRKLQPPPTHQHRPRMYMSVEPTVPRGLAMADARPVGQQNRWWRLPVAHREACVSTLQRQSRGSSAAWLTAPTRRVATPCVYEGYSSHYVHTGKPRNTKCMHKYETRVARRSI